MARDSGTGNHHSPKSQDSNDQQSNTYIYSHGRYRTSTLCASSTDVPEGSTGMYQPMRGADDQAGAISGVAVDFILFPLDTIKTRVQSSQGFVASGGFKGVYRGVGSVGFGSAPGGKLSLRFAPAQLTRQRLPSSSLTRHSRNMFPNYRAH